MTDLTDACADLELWLPALAEALARDNNAPSGGRHVLSAGGVVNPDVLHAMLLLAQEAPAACTAAAGLCGERWQPRPLTTCLRAIPRFHDRLGGIQLPGAARALEITVLRWTSAVKHALGLRTPDQPIGYDCPLHDNPSPLVAVGSDGYMHADGTVTWTHTGLITCHHCGAQWPASQWLHLGRILVNA